MREPDPGALRWAAEVLGPGTVIEQVHGLRDGGSPWLLRLRVAGEGAASAAGRQVVLRVVPDGQHEDAETELAGLAVAAAHGIPVPAVLGRGRSGADRLILVDAVPGTSRIPQRPVPGRLRSLGALAAALHAVAPPLDPALPRRDRPIAGVDFDALRRAGPPRPLLVRAQAAAARHPDREPDGFVHGDLWQGNVLWDGDRLTGVIDWDCAGHGPAGVDLGSLRCDAAICYGPGAAGAVLAGWQDAAGRPAAEVAYWDVVASLSTPPDMGWFVSAIAGQGRSDLTRDLLVRRRDDFLAVALDELDRQHR